MLKDNKFLMYGGGLFAGVAVTIPTITSDVVFGVDNRTMCAPLVQPLRIVASLAALYHRSVFFDARHSCATLRRGHWRNSDIASVGYIEMDDRGAWKQELLSRAREHGRPPLGC